MTVVMIILAVLAYLLIGYGWAMLFIHKLTDGRWATESYFNPGTYRYSPMGVGTAVTFTVLWPMAMASVAMLTIFAFIGDLFSKDFWKRLYRIS